MKVSGRKVAENRAALMETARKLLREHGFEGAGVVEISREAGLTQGALYSQFGSKDALVAEACRKGIADGAAFWRKLRETEPDALSAYLDAYLTCGQSGSVGSDCVMAACVSEMRHQEPAVAAAFAEGFRTMVGLIQEALPPEMPPDAARRRALALASALVGSAAMARALEPTDPALAKDVIDAARAELARLARDPPRAPAEHSGATSAAPQPSSCAVSSSCGPATS